MSFKDIILYYLVCLITFSSGHPGNAQSTEPGFDTIDPFPVGGLGYVRPYDELVVFQDGSIALAAKMKPLMGPAHYSIFKYSRAGNPLKHTGFGLSPMGFEIEIADFSQLDSGSFQVSATGLVGTSQIKRVYRTLKFNHRLDSLNSTGYRTNITPLTYSRGFLSRINGFSYFQDFNTKVYSIPNIKSPLDSAKRESYDFYSFDDKKHIYNHFYNSIIQDSSYLIKRKKSSGQIVSSRALTPGVLKIHPLKNGFYLVCSDTNRPALNSVIIKKMDSAFQLQSQLSMANILPQSHTLLKKGKKQVFTALDTADYSIHVVYGDYVPDGPGYFGNWSYDLGVIKLDSNLNTVYNTALKKDSSFYYLPEDLKVTSQGALVLSLGGFPHSTYAGARLRLVKINANGQIGLDEDPLKGQTLVKVYPNPIKSQLHIRGLAAFRYRLSGPQGRVVKKGTSRIKTENKAHSIKLPAGLPPGSYLLRLESLDGKRVHLQKLMHQ